MKMILKRTAAMVLGLMLGVGAWAGLETVTHISDLNSSWPLGSDLASTSDDHIRNIKVALKTDFPNINAAVTATPTQINQLTTNTFTSAVTGNSFSVSSSSLPTNGIYLPSANTLGFSTGGVSRGSISSGGIWGIAVPTSGIDALDVNMSSGSFSATGNPAVRILNANASAQTPLDWFSNGSLTGRIRNDFAGNMALVTFSSGGLTVFTGGDSGVGTQRFSVNASSPFVQGYGTTAAALVDMTPDKGTFTITYTGMTAGVTGTASWARMGNVVVLTFPAATGTSNATTFTATGLPAVIQPGSLTQQVAVANCENTGTVGAVCQAQVSSASGTITMLLAGGSGGWTNSGVKGIAAASSITYSML